MYAPTDRTRTHTQHTCITHTHTRAAYRHYVGFTLSLSSPLLHFLFSRFPFTQTDLFQDDLFPPTRACLPLLTSDEYFAQRPIPSASLVSLQPPDTLPLSQGLSSSPLFRSAVALSSHPIPPSSLPPPPPLPLFLLLFPSFLFLFLSSSSSPLSSPSSSSFSSSSFFFAFFWCFCSQ